jgi:hypothetical protein
MMIVRPQLPEPPRLPATEVFYRLLYSNFAFFMSQLGDSSGALLTVAPHHRAWCELIATSKRLVLMAPRTHGKSTLSLAYILWQFWRHGHVPGSGQPQSADPRPFTAALFSATRQQAEVLLETFRDLLLANEWLFGEVGPQGTAAARRLQLSWSKASVRLASGAELRVRAYRTSTRGLHPDLLILDDVLNDQNSLSQHQRDLTWRYFVGTLLPMGSPRILIFGTAFHRDDLLHRLAPRSPAAGGGIAQPVRGFVWHRDPALDPVTGAALWPERHPAIELTELRDADPMTFSREYQNEPRDDAASMFPYELTQRALDAGADLTFLPAYRGSANEAVVLGADIAVSAAAGADYTVVIIAAYELDTGRRRVLTIRRLKGLDLAGQIELLGGLCRAYGVARGVVEANGFQDWLASELAKRADTRMIFGHTTGREKTSLADGVPLLNLAFLRNLWVMPTGNVESLQLARAWQAEHSAFGWTDGKLRGLGDHDDLVMASWFLELAVRLVEASIRWNAAEELIYGEDVGLERVHISPDY